MQRNNRKNFTSSNWWNNLAIFLNFCFFNCQNWADLRQNFCYISVTGTFLLLPTVSVLALTSKTQGTQHTKITQISNSLIQGSSNLPHTSSYLLWEITVMPSSYFFPFNISIFSHTEEERIRIKCQELSHFNMWDFCDGSLLPACHSA